MTSPKALSTPEKGVQGPYETLSGPDSRHPSGSPVLSLSELLVPATLRGRLVQSVRVDPSPPLPRRVSRTRIADTGEYSG